MIYNYVSLIFQLISHGALPVFLRDGWLILFMQTSCKIIKMVFRERKLFTMTINLLVVLKLLVPKILCCVL